MNRRRSVALVITAVLATLFVVVIGAGVVATSEPACTYCHSAISKAEPAQTHAAVRCTSCHAAGAIARVTFAGTVLSSMVPAQLAGKRDVGPVTETSRAACLSCHSDINSGVTPVSNGLRINHATCAPGASCDSCHSTVPHGVLTRWKRGPVMEECTACHTAQGAPLTCDTCHAGKSSTERISVGPWQVTHGPNWQKTHGMGDLNSCGGCHAKDYCARCHGVPMPHDVAFGAQHGQLAEANMASCMTCHKTTAYCQACHGITMPHPADFLKVHASIAKTFDNPTCMRCHARESCDACHNRHVHPGNAALSNGLTTTTTVGP